MNKIKIIHSSKTKMYADCQNNIRPDDHVFDGLGINDNDSAALTIAIGEHKNEWQLLHESVELLRPIEAGEVVVLGFLGRDLNKLSSIYLNGCMLIPGIDVTIPAGADRNGLVFLNGASRGAVLTICF